MKENTTKDIDVYSKESTVIERPESYNIGVKVGWTAPAKWWNWLFNACTIRLKELFNTTTSIHNEIKNAVGGTLDPESDTQLKDRLEQMKKELADMTAGVQGKLDALEATKAKPNGIASLDPDGRIPYSQLPESAMEFKGDWDASTNTPALADGTGGLGDMYLVSVGGTVDLGSGDIEFLDGDRVIYNQAGKWEKISGGSVKSVNKTGPDATGNVNVVVDAGHIADSAVTTAKIADGAVTGANIADGAVTSEKISANALKTINNKSIIGSGNIAINTSPFYIVSNSTELLDFLTGSVSLKENIILYLKSGSYSNESGTGGFSFSSIKGLVIAEPGVLFTSDISNYSGSGMYGVKMAIDAEVNSKSIVCSGFDNCKNLYNCECTIKVKFSSSETPVSTALLTVVAFRNCEELIGCSGNATAVGSYQVSANAIGFGFCNYLQYCVAKSSATSQGSTTSFGMKSCRGVTYCTLLTPASSTYASISDNSAYAVADTPSGGFNVV